MGPSAAPGTAARVILWAGLPLLGGAVLTWLYPKATFGIAFAVAGVWLGAATVPARRTGWENVLLALATISFCLAAAELFAGLVDRSPLVLNETIARLDDPDLGFRPRPDQRGEAEAVLWGKPEFDVIYTIDGDGLRVMPAMPAAPCRVAFFGDSFTFGYGLPDDQAMPYRVVMAGEGRYAGYDFAYNGYGPHQMLRAIERGRVDAILHGAPSLVIYQGIVNHVARVAGRQPWDPYGPKYVLSGDGGVRYAGPFHGPLYKKAVSFLNARSRIFHLVHAHYLAPARPRAEDIPIYTAVLKQAKAEIERRYGAPFLVLFWDTDSDSFSLFHEGALARETMRQLERAGIEVIPISRIIPDIDTNRAAYAISSVDTHPNALAAGLIARYLAREIGPRYCPAEPKG